MKTKVSYTKNARRDIRNLDRKDGVKIASKIEFYSKQKNPLRYAKKLKPPFDDLYRFRIGEYRAVFEIDAKKNILFLTILKMGIERKFTNSGF